MTRDELILKWQEKQAMIEKARKDIMPVVEEERRLRQEVILATWGDKPKEGTNTLELGAGYKLKAVIKIERKVDEAVLPAVKERMKELKLRPDMLFVDKPQLDLKVYRQLTAEQQKVVDEALVIKPSAPTLELVEPGKSNDA